MNSANVTRIDQPRFINTVDGCEIQKSHHLETMGNHYDIYRGIVILGLLRWCEMDFVHPQYGGVLQK